MVESISELRKVCYEGHKVNRPWYMKYVAMKISIYITWVFLHTPITSNQVTIIEMFLVIIGSVLMAFGNLWYILIGILLIHLTIFLDCVDGELARCRKKWSLVGMHLEDIYHQLLSYLMFFPLAFGIFLNTGWKSILIFGFLCSVFSKSFIIPNMFSAIVKNRLHGNTPMGYLKKQKTKDGIEKINLQGSELGKRLSSIYNKFSNIWAAPFNIVHLTIISIVEVINLSYQFFPSYIIFYWYLVIYGIAVVLIQIVSFIVHYKGKAAEHYYLALFNKKD